MAKVAKVNPIVERYDRVLRHLYNKEVFISFGPHAFSHTLLYVRLARLADMVNPPEKVLEEGGKYKTPICVLLQFANNDSIVLQDSDVNGIRVTTQGIEFVFDAVTLRIQEKV